MISDVQVFSQDVMELKSHHQSSELHTIFHSTPRQSSTDLIHACQNRSSKLLLSFVVSLNLLNGGILSFVLVFVLLLQALDKFLEVGFCLLHPGSGLIDECVQIGRGHRLVLFDLCLLGIVAQVEVVRAARWAQVLLCVLFQVLQGTASLVIFKIVRVAELDCGVTSDTDVVAQFLASSGAVDICDQDGLGVLVFLRQLVPIGLHLLAVASPRCQELDKHGLASSCCIPVRLIQLHALSGGDQQRHKLQHCSKLECGGGGQ